MRTLEQWSKIWEDLEWFVNFHNKSVWIVPQENNYYLSAVKPREGDLPRGTRSNLYDTDLNIIDSVCALE